jgi:hypothetical protein
MEYEYLDVGLANMTGADVGGNLNSTMQGLKYSLMVLVYLCIRDVLKYAVPLVKALISEKLKEL